MNEPDRLIRLSKVMEMVPLKRSTIYARAEAGTFPQRRDLGGGVVAWSRNEVLAWMEQCPVATKETNLGVGKGVADGSAAKKAA